MNRALLRLSVLAGILFVALPAIAAQRAVTLGVSEKEFIRDPKTCSTNDICDLKRVFFNTTQLRIPPGFTGDLDFYATKFTASYETNRVEELEKYVFVQYIRGCAFYSERDAAGVVEQYLGIGRVYFGEKRIAQHPAWSVDSVDNDPAYLTNPAYPQSRNYFYEWFDPPEKWRSGVSGTYFGAAPPLAPRLFVDDMPFPATVVEFGRAKNASLEFRTCLYKASDVPNEVDDEHNMTFGVPITCAEWKHNFVYDHAKEKFERPSAIDSMCLRPLTPQEEAINRAMRQ